MGTAAAAGAPCGKTVFGIGGVVIACLIGLFVAAVIQDSRKKKANYFEWLQKEKARRINLYEAYLASKYASYAATDGCISFLKQPHVTLLQYYANENDFFVTYVLHDVLRLCG
jgi:hypothetical protein